MEAERRQEYAVVGQRVGHRKPIRKWRLEGWGLYLKMDIGPLAPPPTPPSPGAGNEVKLVDAGHKSLSCEPPLSGRSPFYVHRGHQDFQHSERQRLLLLL